MLHDTLVTRLRAEYLEMPGLRLTRAQAQRLCGIEQALCEHVFNALVAEKFLYVTPDGAYARSSTEAMPRHVPPRRAWDRSRGSAPRRDAGVDSP